MDNIDGVIPKAIGAILVLLMLCTIYIGIRGITISIQQEKDEKIAIEQSYETYYKGEQIDINHVDFSQYDVRVDKENKRVYLTDRQPVSFFVPIFSK